MNIALKLLVGLLTLLPVGYFVLFIVDFLRFPDVLIDFETLVWVHTGMMVLMVGLLVFYVTHLFKTIKIPDEKKTLWAIILFFGSLIAMPVYWYLNIWKTSSESRDDGQV
ncbi:MAG: hypothetical protein KDC44_25105 [Phaeodactylibacter sp.]|nr:hypothetical protein [Phaeodactylibacter sp.]